MHSDVLRLLFDPDKQFCPNCGLRFEPEDYPQHLDDHYMIKMAKKRSNMSS